MWSSMTRRSKTWLVVAVIFTAINIGGVVPAAMAGESLHAGIHVVLALLGAYYVRKIWRGVRPETPALSGDYSDRLTHLEQNIDAVAVEIERIGEGQRFMTRVLTEKPSPEKQPIENKPRKPQ